MVYYRKKAVSNYKKKKRYTRRRNYQGFKTQVSVGTGFPKKMTMRHKLVINGQLSAASGALSFEHFLTNGMFQCNSTYSTRQPQYFDQMKALYNKYTVIGSACRIRFNYCGDGGIVGCFINNSNISTNPSDVNGCCQQSGAKWRYLNDTATNTFVPFNTKLSWSARKRFGKNILNNSVLTGTSAANPSDYNAFSLFYKPDGALTATVSYTIEVDFIAVWTGLIDIDSS